MKYKTIKVDSQIALYWPKMIKDYIYNSDKHIGVMENKHTFDICSRCQTPFGKHTPQLSSYYHCPTEFKIIETAKYSKIVTDNCSANSVDTFIKDEERTKRFKQLFDEMRAQCQTGAKIDSL